MARRGPRPKPWFRDQTESWYVTINGDQVPLGTDEGAAYEEFYRLMAARGESPEAGGDITVQRLQAVWLVARAREDADSTMENYRSYSKRFLKYAGHLKARDLKPYHVEEWVAELDAKYLKDAGRPWSQSTRAIAMTIIKAMTSWADDKGYLDRDPLRKLKPPPIERRDPITLKEATGIMETVRPEIQDALRVLLTTGVRPGELCSMTVERTRLDQRKAVVIGKSGRRTVHLGAPASEVLRQLIERRRRGYLLIDMLDEPMSVNALERCVVRARRKLSEEWFGGGKPMELEHITPHCFRGLFATEALRAGVPMFEVSKLLGHKDPTILAKHYASPDDEMLHAAAELATRRYDNSAGTTPDPPG